MFICNAPGDIRPGTTGRVVPGDDARTLGEDNRPVPPGGSGGRWSAAGSTARCYWNKPEHTARSMVDGWGETGDALPTG